MSHCPVCHAEYRRGFARCADCDVPLAPGAPPAPEPLPPEAWSELCTVTSETEAELIRGYLENAGVPCAVESLKFHAEPVNFGPLSRVRVHVPTHRLAEARALMAELAI